MQGLVLAVALGACGGTSPPDGIDAADAGADGAPYEPAVPRAPAQAETPRTAPCPDGWREIEGPACDPWPASGPATCAIGEAHVPGSPGCTPIGTPCPAGDWAEDLPAGATVLFAKAGAAPGGDGSQAAPFARIDDAIAAADDGTIVAISKGTFDEIVTVSAAVTLWGACVTETVIASSVPSETVASLTLNDRGGATVQNLQVSGARIGIEVAGNADPVVLDSILVQGSHFLGVNVRRQADLVARDLVVADVRLGAAGDFGYGMQISDGSHVELARVSLVGNSSNAIVVANPGTDLVATDLAAIGTHARADGLFGYGLYVLDGGRATIERVALTGNSGLGMGAGLAGSDLVATDVSIAGTVRASNPSSAGVEVQVGAAATISRAWIERSEGLGVSVRDATTDVSLVDVLVRDTVGGAGGVGGLGLQVSGGAHADVLRAAFERNRTAGLSAAGAGTLLVATDVSVAGTQAQESDDTGGYGLYLDGGARVEVTRAHFEGGRAAGVRARQAETTLVAQDLTVEGTLPTLDANVTGFGVYVAEGATADVARAHLAGNTTLGLAVSGTGTRFVGADVAIEDTQPQAEDGEFGYGLEVSEGAQADLVRTRISQSRGVGVVAGGTGSTVSLEDLVVEGTRVRACADCVPLGNGIDALSGGAIAVTRFRISDNPFCGVQLAAGGTIDLSQGQVASNAIGANVQTEGFDLARLQPGVDWTDNEVDLDASALPLPEPAGL